MIWNITTRTLLAALLLVPAFGASAQSIGNRQSPIDISGPIRLDPKAPAFEDTAQLRLPKGFVLRNTTGYRLADNRWASLKAYPDPASAAAAIKFGGIDYKLDEFHFHTPSEHLVSGQVAEMEVHFVFANEHAAPCSASQLLVVGQRITKGPANPELNKIFGPAVSLPQLYGVFTKVDNFTIMNVLTGLDDSYRYAGSLTAPVNPEHLGGCPNPPGGETQQLVSGQLPEVVSWVLLRQTIQMSEAQIARFQALFPNGDARGPQALKGRAVTKTKD